jgi:hypothetical protein
MELRAYCTVSDVQGVFYKPYGTVHVRYMSLLCYLAVGDALY